MDVVIVAVVHIIKIVKKIQNKGIHYPYFFILQIDN